MLLSFLSTIFVSIGIGVLLLIVRRVLGWPRQLAYDSILVGAGAVILLLLHLLSRDLFGLDPWYGLGFELAKHGLELVVIMMIIVAF